MGAAAGVPTLLAGAAGAVVWVAALSPVLLAMAARKRRTFSESLVTLPSRMSAVGSCGGQSNAGCHAVDGERGAIERHTANARRARE